MEEKYHPPVIENAVQQRWNAQHSFKTDEDSPNEKFYCLSMFPYPSGQLHMGHVRVYTITDVIARQQRMLGKNVLQPMGWDAFGLPAENAAIKRNIPPKEWTYKNIDAMRTQFKRLGFGYDWSRELMTCDPSYYRWEQWLFTRLYKKGLVYKKNSLVNWDPVDNTVLANEQVINGRGWRSNALVEQREISQWFLKITAYADELLDGLDQLDWPEQVKTMQRNWIGKSEGMAITFDIPNQESLTVFTTRVDTLFGVTALAIAPQHPLTKIAAATNPSIQAFVEKCRNLKVAEADFANQEKIGIDTGLRATHPLTGEQLPVWITNFVLMNYGSGAVMSVPGHDARDFDFAHSHHLPLKQVVAPSDHRTWDFSKTAFSDYGILINSQQFTGLTSKQALRAIGDALQKSGHGTRQTQYRLRDWGVSRQRYWGTPIPMIYCEDCGIVPVPDNHLPVILPDNVAFTGHGSPLESCAEFVETTCPACHKKARRETDTFDTFMESSWYYARFACVDHHNSMLDERAKYWTPVDQYVGGIEHAVMHLLYARFIHKVMRDEKLVHCDEPFTRLLTQGMVLKDGAKMSKSKNNVVEPLALIDLYGADTVRLFVVFAAPPEQSLEWSDSGVEGAHRFLKRLWAFAYQHKIIFHQQNRLATKCDTALLNWNNAPAHLREKRREIYTVLQQVSHDFKRQQLNTVVSGSMKLFNLLQETSVETASDYSNYLMTESMSLLLRLLSPITPHITQQLWQDLQFGDSILVARWPTVETDALSADQYEIVVQINGKLRSRVFIPTNSSTETITSLVLQNDNIKRYTENANILKTIIIPNKLVNIVVKEIP